MYKISKQLKLIAKEIISLQLIAKGQKQLKKYIKDNILYNNPKIESLQLSTEVGRINKIVKDKLKQIPSNYYRIVYDWLIDGNQIPQQDIQKMVNSIKQYQIIKKNDNKIQNINSFKTYGELLQYINDFNQNNNLEFLQKRNDARNTKLPFKKINSKGNYSMYIIESDQYEDLNRLYGNNNNSEEGGLIATTSWCVALGENYFENYQAPYYLITKNNNQPEALVHIGSNQFKDRDDYVYKKKNKQVYELVIQLLDDNNELSFDGDFKVLLEYVEKQKKDNIVKDILNKRDIRQIFNIMYMLQGEDRKLAFKILYNFGQKIYLFRLFKQNNMTKQQKKEYIQYCMKNEKFNITLLLQQNILTQEQLELIKKLVNQYKDQKIFISLIQNSDIYQDSMQELLDLAIQERYQELIYVLIRKKKINDRNIQKVFDILINKNNSRNLRGLYYLISQNKLNQEQKTLALEQLIQSQHIQALEYLFDLGYFNKQQRQKVLKIFIDNYRPSAIKEIYNKLTDEQKQLIQESGVMARF